MAYFEDLANEITKKLDSTYSQDFDFTPVIPGFGGFVGSYLPGEIKQEIVEFISHQDGLFFFRVEYVTTVIPIHNKNDKNSKPIDFKKSASYAIRSKNYDLLNALSSTGEIDETQNLTTSEDNKVHVIDSENRPFSDKEFYRMVINAIKTHQAKKVVFQTKKKLENVRSTVIKYVVFNSKD